MFTKESAYAYGRPNMHTGLSIGRVHISKAISLTLPYTLLSSCRTAYRLAVVNFEVFVSLIRNINTDMRVVYKLYSLSTGN